MGVADTIAGLTDFHQRGAGSDAERRAALWLAHHVETPRRKAAIETFWCRPNWALAAAWHVTLAIAGSLVTVSSAKTGGALVLAALVFLVLDAVIGRSPGRRLSPERASQNVVSRPTDEGNRVRLIVTANYDAGRAGLIYRDPLRRSAARLRRWAGPVAPGWQAWIALAMVWLLAIAVLRAAGADGSAIGIAQLIPTASLVVALALLLDLASAGFGPAAGDNASGVAVAVALVRALDVAPPKNLSVELVLQGAGDGTMTGLARHLRNRRKQLRPSETIVLGIAPCGAGSAAWWISDGPLIPLRYFRRLGGIAESVAGPVTEHPARPPTEPRARSHTERRAPPITEYRARPHRGRGTSPALPARLAGLPAITLGCLDSDGLAPRSHQRGDVAEALDRDATDGLLGLALTLVDAIDADLRSPQGATPAAPPPAKPATIS
jgi:hypothetical protein